MSGGEYGQGSKSATFSGSGTVLARGGRVWAVSLDGTASASAELRDGGAGGTLRWTLATGPSAIPVVATFPAGLEFKTDIHLILAGVAARANVAFD